MRYRRVLISTVTISLLATTGCVKPTDEPNQTVNPNTNNNNEVVYNEQPTSVVYEDSTPVVYEDPATNSSEVDYGAVEDTVVSTGGYEQPVATTGPFDDPYSEISSASASAGTGSGVYVDPYATSSSSTTPSYTPPAPTYTPSSTYTTDNSYSGTSSSGGGGGIHLQVAALGDYYAAEAFKNGLSLDPKYSAYVKKGAMNKVIIKGFSTRSEAKALANRQFPGAFIVAGSSSSYTSPTPSYTPAVSSAPVGSSSSGIGIQVGAFSSQSAARSAAESSAAGRYTAIVKTVTVRGKTLYKAILLGFNSRAEAKSAIASGQIPNGFVVSNIYP